MWNEDHNEENEMFASEQKEHKERMSREIRKKFREAAYKGYDLLVTSGKNAVDLEQRDEAVLAIRRILGLMITEEEYEKCHFLKNFLVNDLGVSNPDPIFDFEKNMKP